MSHRLFGGLFLLVALAGLNPVRADVLADLRQKPDCAAASVLPGRVEMQAEIQDYLRLAEEALSMRAQAIRMYHALEAKKARKQPLSGQDLQNLNEGAVALIQQRARLFQAALAHECWAMTPPAAGEAGEIQRAGVLMSLSAALVLYDNYLSAISLFRDDPALRQHLNKPDSGVGLSANELLNADRIFDAPEVRRRVRRAIRWYGDHGKAASSFEGYDYLVQSIAQSPSFQLVGKKRPFYVLGRAFEVFGDYTRDTLAGIGKGGSQLGSFLFGNTMGLVETRKGKLYRKPEIEREVYASLQAGDILLEKTPFRLTDTFIPGHWGHAAIWVGSEAELKALGIWEHPVVRPHQTRIRAGGGVAESLRSGVELNSLAHFLNIDDLAVLRPAALTAEARTEAILQALRQIGKDYDFNFDAETTDRMFCSKLVYLAYGSFDWPTSRMLGRNTISPDDIARRALTTDAALTVTQLYHDGKPVAAPLAPALRTLLESGQTTAADSGKRGPLLSLLSSSR
ncbi:MAG: hypothetical protein LBR88_02360 [Zoogloeaceae bacterium]|nr:hypothetical protein [Zoogloeaceae bacterium]